MWRSLSIAKKIYLSMAVIILGYTLSMFFVISAGQLSQTQLTNISTALFPASQKSQVALNAFEQQTKAYEDAVILGDTNLLSTAKAKSDDAIAALDEIAGIAALPEKDQATIRTAVRELRSYTGSAQSLYAEMAAGKMEQKDKAADLGRQATELRGTLQKLTHQFADELQQEVSEIQATTRRNQIIDIIDFVSVVAIAVQMISLVFGGVMRRVNKTIECLRDISEGNLSVRLDSSQDDELGALSKTFNRFVEKLQAIIGQLTQNSQQLGDSAHMLKGNALQIATGSKSVALQSETIASASEEMAATSRNIAENCLQAAKSAEVATKTANEGAEIVQHTVRGMERISAHVQESARTVESLGTRSDQIGQIIGTIQDFADQINLLALNAAIDAARAGEQGRGFAVVADEVRALAGRTTKATEGIRDMIRSIQQETKTAERAKEEGVREVEQGTGEAEKTGKALQAILDQIGAVASQVHQMAAAVEYKSSWTTEITSNIHRISQVVQQTSTDAQASADTTLQLDSLAKNLQELVGQFKIR